MLNLWNLFEKVKSAAACSMISDSPFISRRRPAAAPRACWGRRGVNASHAALLTNNSHTTTHNNNNTRWKKRLCPLSRWAPSPHRPCQQQLALCAENKDDGLNIMWRGGAREGRSGREREGDDWPLLGIMENLEEDPLCCCRAVSDEEWLLSFLILPLPLQSAICFFLMYYGVRYTASISILHNAVCNDDSHCVTAANTPRCLHCLIFTANTLISLTRLKMFTDMWCVMFTNMFTDVLYVLGLLRVP